MKYIIVLSVILFITSCGSTVLCNSDINLIEQFKINRYELWWNMPHEKGTKLTLVLHEEDGDKCREIENSMKEIIMCGGSDAVVVRIAASGVLILYDENNIKKNIDITEIGFFPGDIRRMNELFYSEGLATIIKTVIKESVFENNNSVDKEYFKRMKNNFMKNREGNP